MFSASCTSIGPEDVNNETDSLRWATFNSSSGFSINYPDTWTALDLPQGNHGDKEVAGMLISPSNIFPVVLISRRQVEGLSVKDIATWGEERIVNLYDDYQLDELQPLELDSQQALTRVYLADINTSLPVKSKDVYLAYKQDAVIITLRATASHYEEALQLFEVMVKTFTLTR
jgi:hypothetical protein